MERGSDEAPSGTYVFDHQRSNHGYALNKMCMSLTKEANRLDFLDDRLGYMRKYDVPQDQIDAIANEDWLALTKGGAVMHTCY